MTHVRRTLALLVVAVLAVLAVPASATPGGGSVATIAVPHDGLLRTFNLYVAPRVPKLAPVPLIIVLHGLYNDPASVEAGTGMDSIADTQDVALAYPAGLHGGWNAGNCCGKSPAQRVDDVGFLVEVVRLAALARPIDLNRVYVTGFSTGGMMSLRAVCERPDVFAAAVSVSGSLQTSCAGSTPINAMIIHGQRDTTVPYNGTTFSRFLNVPITSAATSAARLATRSSCVAYRESAAAHYARKAYWGCAGGSSVQLLTVPALGHRWPDRDRDGVDGAALAWTFLRSMHRNA